MWRTILPIVLMLLSGIHAHARGKQSVDALLDVVAAARAIPYADRQAAKEALIARPYDKVLPKVAVRISKAPPEWSWRIRLSGTGIGLGDEKSRIDAEVEQYLRRVEEEQARRDQVASLLAPSERRGERFDRVLDRIEKLLDSRAGAPGE